MRNKGTLVRTAAGVLGGMLLKTPKGVAPGSYSATLTRTLWEDAL